MLGGIDLPKYRRVKTEGGFFFITVVAYRQQMVFSLRENRRMLRKLIVYVRKNYPLKMITGCYYPITCIASGPVRKRIPIFLNAGA
jgi:REP element-mobilizing transposase RayT